MHLFCRILISQLCLPLWIFSLFPNFSNVISYVETIIWINILFGVSISQTQFMEICLWDNENWQFLRTHIRYINPKTTTTRKYFFFLMYKPQCHFFFPNETAFLWELVHILLPSDTYCHQKRKQQRLGHVVSFSSMHCNVKPHGSNNM